MCGRFVQATDPEGLVRFFVVDERQTDDLPPSWNTAPTDPAYAVARHDGRRVLTRFQWGLVPWFSRDAKGGARMINARAETVRTSKAFADSFERKRCLIPADGFYEWEKAGKVRLPWFVHRTDGNPMAFAGLWASWRDRNAPDRPRLLTCTIITTDANDRLASLHDRMPVVLERDAWDAWLDPDADLDELEGLLRPADDEVIDLHRVSTAVNSVRNQGPELVQPVPVDGPVSPGRVEPDEARLF